MYIGWARENKTLTLRDAKANSGALATYDTIFRTNV
jgi:hypothetical protein